MALSSQVLNFIKNNQKKIVPTNQLINLDQLVNYNGGSGYAYQVLKNFFNTVCPQAKGNFSLFKFELYNNLLIVYSPVTGLKAPLNCPLTFDACFGQTHQYQITKLLGHQRSNQEFYSETLMGNGLCQLTIPLEISVYHIETFCLKVSNFSLTNFQQTKILSYEWLKALSVRYGNKVKVENIEIDNLFSDVWPSWLASPKTLIPSKEVSDIRVQAVFKKFNQNTTTQVDLLKEKYLREQALSKVPPSKF